MNITLAPLDRKLLRDLWRVKGQAVAIIFVIASGIALLVMSRGMIISLDETMHAYYDRYRFANVYAPVTRAPNRLVEDIRALDGVADVEGRINGAGLVDLPSVAAPISARVVSFSDRASPINGLHLEEGRFVDPQRNDEAVLLKSFADAHEIRPGDDIAVTLNGAQRRFTVVGLALSPEFIYAIPPGEFVVEAGRYAVMWIPFDAMEAAYDLDGAFNEAVLMLSRNANEDEIIDALDRLLGPFGATGAFGRRDQISNKYIQEELVQLDTMSRVMTPIFLGVAIFLLNIVVTRLVQTEREQIGLIKAFGYSNREVGVHYLKFALTIAVLGALIGWGGGLQFGRWIAGIYQEYFHFPFLVFVNDFRTLAIALVVSGGSAGLGAFFAVRAAVQLTPAVAMRPPAPPKFARGDSVIRRIEGALDQPSTMILRRLARQPVRAALTVLGVGAAMGLSVMMRFNNAATDYMLDVSFNVVDRSDVLVTFVEPQSDKAFYEIAAVEGVIHAEPYRTAAVRFLHETTEHIGAITGLPDRPELNRAVDSDLRAVDINGAGIVLSEQLAELLNISVGDTLDVEVREGRRPLLRLPVSGVVEALIGTPAYMGMSALNAELNEKNRISGVYLKIDEEKRDAVYEKLKAVPKVAGVSLRREAYNSFQKMIDEGLGAFRAIMTVFSTVIAAGVVYNGARIAFFERERDLASLRVMGFTKIEAGYVLLGEIAFLAIVALPVGSIIGFLLWTYLATGFSTELYQIPIVYQEDALGYAALVILIATAIAGAFVQRDVAKLDMATALKTRE